jgi:hypothetical protein
VSKKRRAATRRQAQIRRQEQIRRESAGRRGAERPSEIRAEERRVQRDLELMPLAARRRFLKWLLLLSVVCVAYGIALWFVQTLARETLTKDYPGLWTGLLIGLAVAVGVCWIPGLLLTVRDKAWFWVIVVAVPFTTLPAVVYYCFTRLQVVRRRMDELRDGGGGSSRRPRPGPPPRRPGRRPTTPSVGSTDSIKLLNDR